MKKILLVLAICLFLISGQVFATVVTQRKIQTSGDDIKRGSVEKTVQNTLENKIMTCKPHSETLNADYMGMNISYKIEIQGWVNDKCILEFNAQTQGMDAMLGELFGADSENSVVSFTPKIRCEFTKQQLDYVGDSILEENSGSSRKMLKDPNSIDISNFSNMSSSDAKLLDVVFSQQACKLQNAPDLDKMMQELFAF